MMLASVLALALVVMALRRIHKEGLTVSDQPRQQHFKRSVEEVQRQQKEERVVRDMTSDSGRTSVSYTKRGFVKAVELGFDEVMENVNRALRMQGFQILNDTDVMAVLRKKDMPKQRLLLIYHAELAERVFHIDPSIGLIASGVSVRQDLSDTVHIEFSDPSLQQETANHPDLQKITSELREKLMDVLQSV
ncbi:MAG: DUF302 domain-containing protein [Mariprofundaceae bacterium]|nr:DUF302 domain-containing protein [Mariprofundaceae bacterium]